MLSNPERGSPEIATWGIGFFKLSGYRGLLHVATDAELTVNFKLYPEDEIDAGRNESARHGRAGARRL